MKVAPEATSPAALDAHVTKNVVLLLSPVMVALKVTYAVPAPTSCARVRAGRLQPRVLVLYWNQTCVSNPFGSAFIISLKELASDSLAANS